jgi:hypothetical protein
MLILALGTMKVESMTLVPTLAGGGSGGEDIVVVLCPKTMIFTMGGITRWVIGEKCEKKSFCSSQQSSSPGKFWPKKLNDQKRKKSVQVDRNGTPYGSMVAILHADLWAFAKELDPSLNWDHQPHDARDRLEDRLYSEYNVYGDVARLSNKYVKSEVGGALIQYRYRIGKLIDAGENKP